MPVANLNIKYIPLYLIACRRKQYTIWKGQLCFLTYFTLHARQCKKGMSLSAFDWGMPWWHDIAKKPNCHMLSTSLRCHAMENIVGMNGNPHWRPGLCWKICQRKNRSILGQLCWFYTWWVLSYLYFIWWKVESSISQQTLGRLLMHLSISEDI